VARDGIGRRLRLSLLLCLPVSLAISAPSGEKRLADGRAALRAGRELVLELRVRPGDTYISIGQEYLIDLRELGAVRKRNGDRLPPEGRVVDLPYASLNDDYKARVFRDLFPEDGPREGNWIHRAGSGRVQPSEETLWDVALWLTGRGENFRVL